MCATWTRTGRWSSGQRQGVHPHLRLSLRGAAIQQRRLGAALDLQKIRLPDEEAEIGPVATSDGGHRPEPELDRLSNILRTFNEHFGDFRWEDADRVASFKRWLTDTVFSLAYEPASTR